MFKNVAVCCDGTDNKGGLPGAFAGLQLTHDVGASAAFFSKSLGWQPIARPNNIGLPAAWLQIAPDQELHLVEAANFQASPFEAEFGRQVALALPGEEFEAIKRRLLEQGAELIEPERPTPFARFFFRDPNGYVFEVVPEERDVEVGESDAFASHERVCLGAFAGKGAILIRRHIEDL